MFEQIKSKLGIANEDDGEEDPDDLVGKTDVEGTEPTDPANFLIPEEVHVHRNKLKVDDVYTRTYAADSWPPMIRRGMFTSLIMNANLNFEFTLYGSPYDDIEGVNKLEDLESKLEDKRTGEFERFTPNQESIENTEKTLNAMKQHITQGEKLFDASFYITVYAHSEELLERFDDEIKSNLNRSAGLGTNKCLLQQKRAMQSNSPTAQNKLAEMNDQFKQLMLADGLSRTFPFIEDSFMEEGGCLFGINENSMTPVFIDIFNRSNGYNMLTTGMIGSGKSFSSSQILMEMDASYSNFQQYIIDPMGGFQGVNNALDGDRIILNGTESINPMEIKETPKHVIEQAQGKVSPWTMKKQELRWFFDQFFQIRADERLTNDELSTLDTAITQTYHRFGITEELETHSKKSPTIMDLIDTLRMMAEDAEEYTDTGLEEELDRRRGLAIDLLVSLDAFKPGGEYHNLAQETDIRLSDNRVIYLDLQQIPEQSDDLGIMMLLLFSKLYQNAKTTTDKVALTIDEAHKIMGDSNITGGLEEMFRHSRHFNLSINLISQTPEEFYATETAKTIAKQCTIKRYHRVDSLDEDLAKDDLNMNQNEINYIEGAEMGEGSKDFSQALLKISDEDQAIPLRIKATRDEQMIIDYDPKDDVQDFDTGPEQSLKRALDLYNSTETPIFVAEDDDLSNEVRLSIARKERNRKRVLAQEDPSLLSEADRKSIQQETSQPSSEQPDSSDGDYTSNNDTTSSDTNESDEPIGMAGIKKRIGGRDGIDNLDDTEVELIAKQYNIGDSDSESNSIDDLRKKIKDEFFGKISNPNPNNSNTDSDSDSNETQPKASLNNNEDTEADKNGQTENVVKADGWDE